LFDGSHTFRVNAMDTAGNIETTPVSYTWTIDTIAPTVSSVTPANSSTLVAPTTNVTATFSEAMNPDSISGQTFTLVRHNADGTTPVSASVSYNSSTRVATLDPSSDLAEATTYTATIKAGSNGVMDPAGNPIVQDKTWSFATGFNPGSSVTITSNPLDCGSACLTTVTRSVTITNNTPSQVDLFPSVTNLAFSVASDELHIAPSQSIDLPVRWSASGAHKLSHTGRLELKNAGGSLVATSDLKAFTFCPIDG
jgi:hypothetical protein